MNLSEHEPLSVRMKISAVVIVVLLALTVIPSRFFGLGKKGYEQQASVTNPADLLVQQIHNTANEDPDGDGIPNWQEKLLGTDPNSPMTNGVPDSKVSQAIVTNQNNSPSNDVVPYQGDPKLLSALNDDNNISSVVAKNNAGLAVYLNQQAGVDTTSAEKIGVNVIEEASKLAAPKTYTARDITIDTKESFTSIKNYGNTIGALFIDTLTKMSKTDDIAPLETFSSTNNASALLAYTSSIATLQKTIDTLLTITVPASAVDSHVLAINALESYRMTLYNFSKAGTDSTRSLIALNSYKDVLLQVVGIQKTYKAYFDTKGVVFGPKDSGFLFMQDISQ